MKITSCFLGVVIIISTKLLSQTQIGTDINGEAASDFFGESVNMPDGKTLAVGASFNDGNGLNSGHVRVYRWNGNTWLQKGDDIDGEGPDDKSGNAVSMPDSNTIAIGAYFNDGNGLNSGHVRVYRWNGVAWLQKGSDIDGEAAGDSFGTSVSMPDSNTLAIGGEFNDVNGSNAGHVRIYKWNGSTWLQKGNDIDGEGPGDLSGYRISMPDSNTVAIGAPRNSGNGFDAGHVRVYRWNGVTWLQRGNDIDGEAAFDLSGIAVNMPDSNTLAIGASANGGNGFESGHVRVYSWNGSTWIQKGIDINGEAPGDASGISVSMPNSNTIAIGANWNDGNGSNAGHVRIYIWNGSTWLQKGGDIDGEAARDYSGFGLSMVDTNTIAIGAWGNDGNGPGSGHVRVYKFCSSTMGNFSHTACIGYTIPGTNHTYSTSGTFIDTISNYQGCDSIIQLNLTINEVDTSVTITQQTITSNATNALYRWLDCSNGYAVINGEIDQSFTFIGSSGDFAVEVTENGCTDTSACIMITSVGTKTNNFNNYFNLYPNPTDGKLQIRIGELSDNIVIIVRNYLGQIMFKKEFYSTSLFDFPLDVIPGIYFLEISAGVEKNAMFRIIKE